MEEEAIEVLKTVTYLNCRLQLQYYVKKYVKTLQCLQQECLTREPLDCAVNTVLKWHSSEVSEFTGNVLTLALYSETEDFTMQKDRCAHTF